MNRFEDILDDLWFNLWVDGVAALLLLGAGCGWSSAVLRIVALPAGAVPILWLAWRFVALLRLRPEVPALSDDGPFVEPGMKGNVLTAFLQPLSLLATVVLAATPWVGLDFPAGWFAWAMMTLFLALGVTNLFHYRFRSRFGKF